ncbi:MAG: TrkA family potassium uptake protein [Thermotogae bacterium]|nr:MAG: TrkA family potassium uptake protein [Thermotogota bacterium]
MKKNTKKRTEGLYIVIVGCGRIGSIIASRASSAGTNVVILDKDDNAFEALASDFTGFTITGDATELEYLKEAKTDRANILLALTAEDNTNFMVATVAKYYFGVNKVVARVNEPENEEIFKEFGITIISPTMLMVEQIKSFLSSEGAL